MSSSALWNAFVERLKYHNGPLEESAARDILGECARDAAEREGKFSRDGLYWRSVGQFISGPTRRQGPGAVPKAPQVAPGSPSIGPVLRKRLALPRRCESPNHKRQSHEEEDLDQVYAKESLMVSGALLQQALRTTGKETEDGQTKPIMQWEVFTGSPSRPVPRPKRPAQFDLGSYGEYWLPRDWEVSQEGEGFRRVFGALADLLGVDDRQEDSNPTDEITTDLPLISIPPPSAFAPGGLVPSFAAFEFLKIALLLRVACAPAEWPILSIPGDALGGEWALLQRRLASLLPVGIGKDGGCGVVADRESQVEEESDLKPQSGLCSCASCFNPNSPVVIGGLPRAAPPSSPVEYFTAACEYVRASSALDAVRVAINRFRASCPAGSVSMSHAEEEEVAKHVLQGEFRRFLVGELFPKIAERRKEGRDDWVAQVELKTGMVGSPRRTNQPGRELKVSPGSPGRFKWPSGEVKRISPHRGVVGASIAERLQAVKKT